METLSAKDLARCIDHTLFATGASRADIEKICAEAKDKFFHAVAVNTSRVALAASILEETDIKVVGLVGFPLGAADADAKRYEAEIAIDFGAQEIDYVINVGKLKDGDSQFVLREMRDIVEAADERTVKVILETHLLSREEKILVCQMAVDSGAHFVVNATGAHSPPVSTEDIKLLRETVGEKFGVKAVSGITDSHLAIALIEAGATRLGTSHGPTIVEGLITD